MQKYSKYQVEDYGRFGGEICECTIIFTYFNSESIYCFPDQLMLNTSGLLAYASGLDMKILYPMSGIARKEPLIAERRIDVLIGLGNGLDTKIIQYQIKYFHFLVYFEVIALPSVPVTVKV